MIGQPTAEDALCRLDTPDEIKTVLWTDVRMLILTKLFRRRIPWR